MAKLSRNRAYLLQLISLLTGLAVSLYMLAHHTRLKNGIQDGPSFCAFGKYADCDVVNTSVYSEFFGFPLAALGALFYGLLFSLSLLSPPAHPSFARTQRIFGILAVSGFFVDMILFGVQLFALRNFCVMCLVSYVATALAIYSAAQLSESQSRSFIDRLKSVLTKKRKQSRAHWHNVTASSAAGIAIAAVVFLLPSFILHSSSQKRVENVLERFFDEFRSMPRRRIDAKSGDGVTGNSGARIRMVVFSDFECPHCQQAAFTLKTALEPMSDRIFLIFKHFPLDSDCNSLVTYRMHENACKLARLSFCANRKNRFWEFHDLVFERIGKGDKPRWEQFRETVAPILSEREIDTCLKEAASLQSVRADIRLGDTLQIRGTPSLFINGKLIGIPITVENVRRLVEIETGL